MSVLGAAPVILEKRHVIPAFHPRHPATVTSAEDHLHIVVNEYTSLRASRQGLKLVLTHGTSFNKDLWKPIVEFLLRDASPVPISCILALDAVNHGDSASANIGKLGDRTSWVDHSYDILQVITHFGIRGSVIGIGHSFGGGTLSHAAMIDPTAFLATIFIEPILFQMKEQTEAIAKQALKRRDRWADLNEVLKSFSGSRGMADWTIDQRERYARVGTKTVSDGSATFRTLKTSKEQEAATYLAGPFPDIITLLSASRGKHYFVLGGTSKVLNQENRKQLQDISKRTGDTIFMPSAGHLIPMTHPTDLGEILETLLLRVLRAIPEGPLSPKSTRL